MPSTRASTQAAAAANTDSNMTILSTPQGSPIVATLKQKTPPVVTITLDESGTKYYPHEALLIKYSPYFEAALTGGFKESTKKEKALTIEDTSEDTFELFLQWLYAQSDPSSRILENLIQLTSEAVDLYVLGDRYNIPQLRNHTLTALHTLCENKPTMVSCGAIERAFSALPETSGLWRYIVDSYIRYHSFCNVGSINTTPDEDRAEDLKAYGDLPGEFLARVMFGYKDRLTEKSPDVEGEWDRETLKRYLEDEEEVERLKKRRRTS